LSGVYCKYLLTNNLLVGDYKLKNKITSQVIEFYSSGHKIVGDLFLPDTPAPPNGFPAVICAHGYGGIRKTTTPPTARAYAEAGFASMIFDFRGFGDSGGERWRLLPQYEIEDTRQAITFLSADPRINSEQIGLHGSSFGGAVALSTTAADIRVKAMVCSVAMGNGRRWLQSLRRHWEWIDFEKEVKADRIERVKTGKSRRVDPYYIMMSDPFSEQRHVELNRDFPERKFELPLESAEAIMEFTPEDDAAGAPHRPGLIIGVKDDYLVPESESHQIYAKWPGPKKLVMLDGFRHHDVYASALEQVMAQSLPFMRENLQVKA